MEVQKITLLTIGTRGDVLPYILLAKKLKEEGFCPLLALPEDYQDLLGDIDFQTYTLPVDVRKFLSMEQSQAWLRKGDSFAMLKAYQKAEAVFLEEFEKALARLFEGEKPDLMIGNFMMNKWLLAVAEKYSIPIMVAYAQPLGTASRTFPHIQISTRAHMPRFVNLLTHHFMDRLRWRSSREVTNNWRKKLGLPKQKIPFNKLLKKRAIKKLYFYSSHVFPLPDDWGDNELITGRWDKYYITPQVQDDVVPDDLRQWLQEGTSPVYLGFGSMPVMSEQLLEDVISLLVEEMGFRLLISSGWSTNVKNRKNTNSLFFTASCPHDQVFPQCLFAIHHGGAGTMHAALRAGIPSVVCSIISDQHFWGKLLERQHLGAHTYLKTLDKSKLKNAIQKVLQEKTLERCKVISPLLKEDDGLTTAVDVIRKFLTTPKILRK